MSAPATTVILLSSVGTVTVAALSSLAAGKTPPARIAAGGLIMAVGLSTLAQWAPTVASGLAGLVFITALVGIGSGAYTGISKSLSTKAPKK